MFQNEQWIMSLLMRLTLETKSETKSYKCVVKIEWDVEGIAANSKEEAKLSIIDSFLSKHRLLLEDYEITELKREEVINNDRT